MLYSTKIDKYGMILIMVIVFSAVFGLSGHGIYGIEGEKIIMTVYKKLLKYTSEVKHYLYLAIIFSIIGVIFMVVPYYYIYKFLQEIFMGELEQALKYSLIIVFTLMVYVVVYFLALLFSHLLGFRLESNLKKAGLKNLMQASWGFFDLNESGRVRKILDDNTSQTHMLVAHLIVDTCAAIATPLGLIGVLLIIDYKLAILFILLILSAIPLLNAMTGDKQFLINYNKALEKMNGEAVEYIRGMQVVKIFNAGLESFTGFYNSIMDYSKLAYNYTMSCRRPYVAFQVIFNLVAIFALPFAVYFINRGEDINILLPKLLIFSLLAGKIFNIFMKIMYVGMYSLLADQAVDKIDKLVDEMKEKEIRYGNEEKFVDMTIEFKDVAFKYDEKYILEDLNFKLEEGKTYALVGASGGGKSTIAKLISGFYKIDRGEILIGGKSIYSYSEYALNSKIANVFQNAKLFKTTIFENVKMARESASYEEVMEALSLARCQDILDKFEEKENTVIGTRGVYLSGGEKQRIAIARAILKDASIIILDEASAAADPENEFEIQRAFSNLMKGKTVIMIAHRLSSIKNVDHIIVVEDGKIVEEGRDKELMDKGGRYRKLQEDFAKANEWRVYG